MSHLDPDQLALLALGETVASRAELAHAETCPTCRAELSQLRRTVQIARSTVGDDALESPPDRVWHGIATELGLSAATAAGAESSIAADEDAAAAAPRTVDAAADASAGTAPRGRRVGRGARRMRAVWALAASLVLVAGVGLGVWAVTARLAPVSIAAASLAAFPDHPGAEGTADVEEARDGSRTLVVSLESGAFPDAYREVWLIRNDAAALVSLGVLTGDRGSFPIPDGLDLSEYSIVDVSVEPLDGDPAHSGDSIVRGELDFV
jgi:hypothetical protein